MANVASTETLIAPGAEVRVSADDLEQFVKEVFHRCGLKQADAELAAESLLAADRRGISSHGVARLPFHVKMFQLGYINCDAELITLRETSSALALDADGGCGHVLAPRAMDRCIDKAAMRGLCMTTVRNSNHFGIAGFYAMRAAERGLAGMAFTNSESLTLPTFGREPRFGTNPIAMAVPLAGEPPLVIDMATSTVTWGKIQVARRAGSAIPPGWMVDQDGLATTDPWQYGALTPLGGEPVSGGHKGYCLGLLVDLLCGPLASGPWSFLLPNSLETEKRESGRIGHAFMAWQIEAFTDRGPFDTAVKDLLSTLRATPVAVGSSAASVLAPGDPELIAAAVVERDGVPIQIETWDSLTEISTRLGLKLPDQLPA